MRYRLTVEFEVPEEDGDPRYLKVVHKVVDYAMRKLDRYDVDIDGIRVATSTESVVDAETPT